MSRVNAKCHYCGQHTRIMILMELGKPMWFCSECFKEMFKNIPSNPPGGRDGSATARPSRAPLKGGRK